MEFFFLELLFITLAGEFLALPGFEWQGDAGDHCVIYPAPGPLDAPSEFEALARSTTARGALLNAHAVYLPSEFRRANHALTGIEVTRDSHGTEWLGAAAIERGVATAFLGGGDTHGGALGATALTGVRAPRLSTDAVFRAIRERRTWATNGERIVVDFRVDLDGPVPRLDLTGVGTAPIERIEVLRNGSVVAEARGFDGEEFRFSWEDDDLLRPECVSAPMLYHARVVQSSMNRYDPSRRDLAVTSPVVVSPAAAHFDSAHVRRGGDASVAPGSAIVKLREIWSRLGFAADVPPRARPLPDESVAGFGWAVEDLEEAVRGVNDLARRDRLLLELAIAVSTLPRIAEAHTAVVEARDLLRSDGGTAARESARAAQERVAVAEGALRVIDRQALDAAWFAAAQLLEQSRAMMDEMAAQVAAGDGFRFHVEDAEPRSEWELPVDARAWTGMPHETDRGRRLRRSWHEHWGYTDPPPGPDTTPAARLRIIAEGDPHAATIVGPDGWGVPFERAHTGWVATVPASRVPAPGTGTLRLRFDPPVRLGQVFLEGPLGERRTAPGRVTSFEVRRLEGLVHASISVTGAPVLAELWRRGPRGHEPVWFGRLETGVHPLVFPPDTVEESDRLTLRWGFGGWRHRGSVRLAGHDAARPLGFGVMHDGRALVALADSILLVDAREGTTVSVSYPPGCGLEPGREFCVADLGARGVVVRGADSPSSSWTRRLDPATGGWSEMSSLAGLDGVEAAPHTGTIVSDASGRLCWLTGRTLHAAEGGRVSSCPVDVSGRLLAAPASGAVVALPNGGAAQLSSAGAVNRRVAGDVLAADPFGGLLLLDGLESRHAELALGIRVFRVHPDGSRSGPFRLETRPSPSASQPVFAGITPDGSLLLLGGTTHWRREPDHDWWGAVVDRWDPVWVGRITAP